MGLFVMVMLNLSTFWSLGQMSSARSVGHIWPVLSNQHQGWSWQNPNQTPQGEEGLMEPQPSFMGEGMWSGPESV